MLPAELLVVIAHYQQKRGSITQSAPGDFLAPYEQHLLVDPSGKFRVSLYKSLLFIKIAEVIKAGALNVKYSYKYWSLDDYLISKAAWKPTGTTICSERASSQSSIARRPSRP
jgi:hypothetical protein